jgi:hypothetical protein
MSKPGYSQKGVLEVGTDGKGNVVINHPDIQPDENGAGYIVFTPKEARALANVLVKMQDRALKEPQP